MPDDWASPYNDDATIEEEELLYRRIKLPDWVRPNELDSDGRPRIRSVAFQDFTEALAFKWGLASVLAAHGRDASALIEHRVGYGVAGLRASDVRQFQQGIQRHPTDNEPWHAIVFCLHRKSKNEPIKDRLAEKAVWILPPPV
jgi:hypothetical protein